MSDTPAYGLWSFVILNSLVFEVMLGWKVNPQFGPFQLASNVRIFGGILLSAAWQVLCKAQSTVQPGERVYLDDWGHGRPLAATAANKKASI